MLPSLVAARIERETHRTLKELACHQGRTVGYLVRKAIEEYVESTLRTKVRVNSDTYDECNEDESIGGPKDGC